MNALISFCKNSLRVLCKKTSGFFQFFSGDNSAAGVLFNADGSLCAPKIFAAFNPSSENAEIPIPDCLREFRQIADIDDFSPKSLDGLQILPEGNAITLPPVSLGVWIGG